MPFPSPGDHPNPETEPRLLHWQEDSLPSEPRGKPYLPIFLFIYLFICCATWHVGSLFPNHRLNPGPRQWKHRVLTTRLPGKYLSLFQTLSPTLVNNPESEAVVGVLRRLPGHHFNQEGQGIVSALARDPHFRQELQEVTDEDLQLPGGIWKQEDIHQLYSGPAPSDPELPGRARGPAAWALVSSLPQRHPRSLEPRVRYCHKPFPEHPAGVASLASSALPHHDSKTHSTQASFH